VHDLAVRVSLRKIRTPPLLGMNTDLDRQEILDLYRSGALVDAIFDNFGSALQEETVISKCAEMHNQGEINLLALIESPNFNGIDVHRFFPDRISTARLYHC
jgi:hypothetical protein